MIKLNLHSARKVAYGQGSTIPIPILSRNFSLALTSYFLRSLIIILNSINYRDENSRP